MPAPLELGLSTSSASDTGDNMITPEFSVDFGTKNAGRNAQTDAGGSVINGLVKDGVKAIAIALATKYLWRAIK